MDKLQTLKGFRDFLPSEMKKRQYVIDTLRKVFESYGFEPLETPALEYAEILLGKYGEEADKLLYTFIDRGGRKVGMRYDQTVPLSRVVAQYQNDIPLPFKRYQIQPVWRAENTQRGRYREFLQCDIDIVGTDSFLSDDEILAVVSESFS
jgi:histidyl-tRNA synthetase